MSKKTVSQMEAELMDKISKTKDKLERLQERHKLEIGSLAYKHGLHQLSIQELEFLFAKMAVELDHGRS